MRLSAFILAASMVSSIALNASAGPTPGGTSSPVSAARSDAAPTWRDRLAEYQPWIEALRKRSAVEMQKLQQWEYHVVKVNTADPVQLTTYLNDWGKEGWECFHIVSSSPPAPGALPSEYLFFLRRRPSSWFSQVPYRDLLKMLLSLSEESEAPPEEP